MNIKNNPYYWSHFLRLFVTLFTAPSFSVRKFVFTIIQPLALVQGKKVAEPKAKAAFDAAEHARPQASSYSNRELHQLSL